MKGENTIRRETDNAILLKRMGYLLAKETSIERLDSLTARSLNFVFP